MTEQLRPVDLVAPGSLGLNSIASGSLLTPEFATKATNAVIDSLGRLAARKGYTDVTSTDIAGSPPIKTIFEYRTALGATETIVAWDGGIANDIGDPVTNDVSGSVTDSNGRWWMQNFAGSVLGFQHGQKPIVYSGSTFATVVESSGTAPTSRNGVGLCAYGRVWALDSDGITIKYSGLLDETDWGGAGSGSIDMTNIWTEGTDEVTGIAAFNGALIVFGKKHIVFWVDGQGNRLGLDPDVMYVADVISGTGLVSQWTVQPVGDTDLLYLSPSGIQSINRLISERSNPISTLSKKVRTELLENVKLESDVLAISSAYSPINGFYLLTLPDQSVTYALDQKRRYTDEDGDELSAVTKWTLAPTAWSVHANSLVYLGGTWGVGQYGASSDAGSQFRFVYQSPWLDLGEDFANFEKILKRIGVIIQALGNTDIVFKWNSDFAEQFRSATRSVQSDATAEWAVAEWGLGEWSGGLTLRIIKIPARGRGQYFRIGIEADVNGQFAIQQAELFAKLGRLS